MKHFARRVLVQSDGRRVRRRDAVPAAQARGGNADEAAAERDGGGNGGRGGVAEQGARRMGDRGGNGRHRTRLR